MAGARDMKSAMPIRSALPARSCADVSGAGVARHAPNAANAEALLGYLLRDDVQAGFALGNNEYPVVAGVPASGPIAGLGTFREDDLPMAALGQNQTEAVKVFDEAGWK